MLAGELYDAYDLTLPAARRRVRESCMTWKPTTSDELFG